MAETLRTQDGHEGRESWRNNYDTSLEGRVGRHRKAGRGIMALLNRMHRVGAFLGIDGKRINHGNERHRFTIPAQRELTAAPQNRALTSGESAPTQVVRTEHVTPPSMPAIVPEASNIRPEIPPEALRAVPAQESAPEQVEYTGRHRARPENLEQYEARLRTGNVVEAMAQRVSALEDTPRETAHDGFTFSGEDVIPESHSVEGIAGSELWDRPLPQRTPGELYVATEDISNMDQRTLQQRGIVTHDNNRAPQPAASQPEASDKPQEQAVESEQDWFGGSNARR
jgi:hypothetical protein